MFIDIHVHPAFYEPINEDPTREDLRHEALDIHKNGTAPLEHIFNQMRCAGLDKLCLLPEDYSGSVGCLQKYSGNGGRPVTPIMITAPTGKPLL